MGSQGLLRWPEPVWTGMQCDIAFLLGQQCDIASPYSTLDQTASAIDLNYSTLVNHREMEFVVPGPGARDGIAKCFCDTGGLADADVIRWVTETAPEHFERLGLGFRDLWGRPLQLIDCQNLFCETDKYARVAHPKVAGRRSRIKQIFTPTTSLLEHRYPPKWGLPAEVTASTS